MRRFVSAVFAGIVLLCMAAPAHALITTPVKVIDEPGDQQSVASGNGVWYAFTANSSAHPNRFNAFAQHVDGSNRTRLNPQGTSGHAGNFDPVGNVAIFTQYSDSTRSNLWFNDLDSHERTKVPGVNTKWFEYNGLVSTDYVLFDRDHKVGDTWYTDLVLSPRSPGSETVIGSWRARNVFVTPGSVGDTTASYEVVKVTARGVTINAYVYTISGGSRSKIPVPARRFAYAPTVDETNGEVYFVRAASGCGANVSIRRVPLADIGAKPELLASMQDGVDVGGLSLAPNGVNLDLLFTRYSCPKNTAHIFSLPGVDTA